MWNPGADRKPAAGGMLRPVSGPRKPPREGDRIVYRSDRGRVRPEAPPPPRAPRGDGIARVRREIAGRRGKPVTTVQGLGLASDALAALAAELKRMCGSGGTAKDGVIEIQGDHVERVIEALRARGFEAKRAGG
jgi:translation initiation factor 1